MSNTLTIKIAGPAGLGIKSSGLLLSQVLLSHGFNIKDYSEYPSLIRGGHNTYQVSFSSFPIFSPQKTVDLFFSLSKGHHQQHQDEFHSQTLIFTPQNVPLEKLYQTLKTAKVTNTIFLGILTFLLDLNQTLFEKLIKRQYSQQADLNLKAFKAGYNYAKQNLSDKKIKLKFPPLPKHPQKLYDGNQAFSWGFIKGGGNFYAAYPMTPSTGALHTLADLSKKHSLKVIHPEDEIAAASLVTGATFAGARSAVGTSGGGFSLMNETVSFCGMAEIGVVFYLVSRPGPATGLPTWTDQSDLLHAVSSGHGDFPKIVLAVSDQQDSFDLSLIALDLAQQLQIPVILLSDKFIAESSTGLEDLSSSKTKTNLNQILLKPPSNFKRYNWSTKSGISPRTLPGTRQGEFLANSYEHDQMGFSTEDSETITKMRQKRAKKLKTALKFCPQPFFSSSKKAKKLIISWGSTKGPIREALKFVKKSNTFAHLHLRTLYPLDLHLESIIKPFKKTIIIENNQTGQLSHLLKSQFDFNPTVSILKFNGRPFFPEELAKKLNET